jgi:hypothetical protein
VRGDVSYRPRPSPVSSNAFPAYRPTPRVSSAPSARPIPRPFTHRL